MRFGNGAAGIGGSSSPKAATNNPQCFIMKPDEVRKLAKRANRAVLFKKERHFLYWLGPNKYDTDKFREAWDRIGRGDLTTLQPRRAKEICRE